MTARHPASARRRPRPQGTTVLALVRAATLRIGLLAVVVVGVVLLSGAAALLHLSALRNLELQARSVAFSVEAAVAFQDSAATESLLQELLLHEPVAQASVSLPGVASPPFAVYRRPAPDGAWQPWLATLWHVQARVPVRTQGRTVGELRLQADASMVLHLAAWAAAGAAVAMLLAGLAVVRVSRQFADRLVRPLQALAEHTRQLRLPGPQAGRAPRAGVQELDALSADFDALLDALQAHSNSILQAHEALRSAHERLASQVREDPLTGAATRAHFEQCLQLAIAEGEALAQAGGVPEAARFSLYFVDANHFKAINDQHGHDAGDQVLIAVAGRLKRSVRQGDLVGRLGGDEFIVLVQGLRDAASAQRIAAQLCSAVAEPLALPSGLVVTPAISVGLAIYPDHGRSAPALMRVADLDMYRHKRAGRRPPDPTSTLPRS